MNENRRIALAKLACAYSGITWGLFWFPLRWLDQAGVHGAWIGIAFFGTQLILLAPLALWRLEHFKAGGRTLLVTAFFAGGSLALYALAVVYTEVIRAMLLFYLTPVWSTLLARAVLREPVTPLRWLAIAMALIGMLVIFGVDAGVPWPRNVGDWAGLASGLMWAVAAVRLRTDRQNHPLELTVGFAFWGTVVCGFALLAPLTGAHTPPAWDNFAAQLWWLAPAIAIIAVPGVLAAMWGPKFIDPGLVSLLFMTEIVVGTVTVAIWAGEPFGWREIIGVVLISGSALLETIWLRARPRDMGAAPTNAA